MNSKARVQAAFSGSGKDRLPMWYSAEPDTTNNVMNLLNVDSEEALMQILKADFRTIRARYIGISVKTFDSNSGLIDIFFFANDFGTQKGLFISPKMWRQFFLNPTVRNWRISAINMP